MTLLTRWLLAALCCAALAAPVVRSAAQQGKPQPDPTHGLKMRLIARQSTYALDLGGKSEAEFRKLLDAIDPFKNTGVVPPGPRVDLVLEIANTSDKDVTIWIGGDDTALRFDLKGPGAVSKLLTFATTADLKYSRPVVIPAGKTYTQPVTNLGFPHPRANSMWYWTRPGEYTLSATWQLGGSKTTGGGPVLIAAPIKLTVTAPIGARAEDYLTRDGRLKERLEIQELQGGIAGYSGGYRVIDTDGTWGTGSLFLRGGEEQTERTFQAKGKLTAAQLRQLAEVLARHDLAGLKDHGQVVVNPRTLTIKFGKKTVTLLPGQGKASAEKDRAVRARYAAIDAAVQAVCRQPAVRVLGVGVSGMPGMRKEITTDAELARLFDEKTRALLRGLVDFGREKLVWVTWQGSSSGGLAFRVREDNGKVKVAIWIHTPSPALTDLRMRGQLIVLPKDANWEYGNGEPLLGKSVRKP